MSAPTAMTRTDCRELEKVVRLNARVAKADVESLAARRLADVEAELAATYSVSDIAWREITEQAKKMVKDADAQIADRCRALGIRPEFRPELSVHWYSRGENSAATRRAELRKVAVTELAARAKLAKVEIARCEAAQLTQLATGLLTSDEARAFLETMPTPEELVPPVALLALEQTLGETRRY